MENIANAASRAIVLLAALPIAHGRYEKHPQKEMNG
jgi:hypothetical protein